MSDELVALAARLDEIAAAASAIWLMHSDVEALRAASHSESNEPLFAAMQYMFVERANEEHRQRYGFAFAPMIEFAAGVYPPPLDRLPDTHGPAWMVAVEVVSDPMLIARFSDLLWEARVGADAHLHARAAIDAYESYSQESHRDALERALAIGRAHELAQVLNDTRSARTVAGMAGDAAKAELESGEHRPGIAFRLLDIVKTSDQDAARSLLDQAAGSYAGDPDSLNQVDEYRVALASNDADRIALRERQVQRLLARADQASGVTAYAFREEALAHATLHGLRATADAIRLEMQRSPLLREDFAVVRTEFSLPTEVTDAFLESARAQTSWLAVFEALIAQGPPTGNLESNKEMADAAARGAPLASLLAKSITGPHGFTTRVYRTQEERARYAVAQAEGLGLAVFVPLLVRALGEAADRLGSARVDELSAGWTGPLIDAETAERLATGVRLYTESLFDESACVILPRLERVIRELSSALGLVIVDEPRAGRDRGGTRTLRPLLNGLATHPGFDPSWHRFLDHVLVDEAGLNLRNDYLHGIRGAASQGDAALLLYIAAYLGGVEVSVPPEQSA